MHLCKLLTVASVAAVLSVSALAQDNSFQVGIAQRLVPDAAATQISLSNSGASWGLSIPYYTAPTFDPVAGRIPGPLNAPGQTFVSADGVLCINAYVFSQDEQLQACCSCRVTPNAYRTWTAAELVSNTLTGVTPPGSAALPFNDAVIKLISTAPNTATCTVQTAATAGRGTNVIAPGLLAWVKNSAGSLTAFTNSALSAYELSRATSLCQNIIDNGSGRGVCPPCRSFTP